MNKVFQASCYYFLVFFRFVLITLLSRHGPVWYKTNKRWHICTPHNLSCNFSPNSCCPGTTCICNLWGQNCRYSTPITVLYSLYSMGYSTPITELYSKYSMGYRSTITELYNTVCTTCICNLWGT